MADLRIKPAPDKPALEDPDIRALLALDVGYAKEINKLDGLRLLFLGLAYPAGRGWRLRPEAQRQLDEARLRHWVYRGKR